MNKTFFLAAAGCLAFSLALTGCGSSKTSDSVTTSNVSSTVAASSQATSETGSIGTAIKTTTKSGDLEITVEGFVNSATMYKQFATSEKIGDGKGVGVLELIVNNVSYDNQSLTKNNLEGYVEIDNAVSTTDATGVTMNPMSSAVDYGEYKGAAGALFKCPIGQAKRAAVLYIIDSNLSQVTVHVGNTTVAVPVTQE